MFESLSDRLGTVFDRLRGRGALSEQDVRDAMREVRVALLDANDVAGRADEFGGEQGHVAAAAADFQHPHSLIQPSFGEQLAGKGLERPRLDGQAIQIAFGMAEHIFRRLCTHGCAPFARDGRGLRRSRPAAMRPPVVFDNRSMLSIHGLHAGRRGFVRRRILRSAHPYAPVRGLLGIVEEN